MGEPFTYSGQCHCGAIRGALASAKHAGDIEVRACQCGFCTRHGAMTISDPAGHVRFEIDRAGLTTYEFGTRTGTSLLCARCGMYAGVILEDDGRTWSVLNARGLAIPAFLARAAAPMVYDGESPAARIARRKLKWTPTEIAYV